MTVIVAFAFIVGFVLAYLIGREDGAEAELELWASDSNSPVSCTSRSIRDTRRTIGPDCDA